MLYLSVEHEGWVGREFPHCPTDWWCLEVKQWVPGFKQAAQMVLWLFTLFCVGGKGRLSWECGSKPCGPSQRQYCLAAESTVPPKWNKLCQQWGYRPLGEGTILEVGLVERWDWLLKTESKCKAMFIVLCHFLSLHPLIPPSLCTLTSDASKEKLSALGNSEGEEGLKFLWLCWIQVLNSPSFLVPREEEKMATGVTKSAKDWRKELQWYVGPLSWGAFHILEVTWGRKQPQGLNPTVEREAKGEKKPTYSSWCPQHPFSLLLPALPCSYTWECHL